MSWSLRFLICVQLVVHRGASLKYCSHSHFLTLFCSGFFSVVWRVGEEEEREVSSVQVRGNVRLMPTTLEQNSALLRRT